MSEGSFPGGSLDEVFSKLQAARLDLERQAGEINSSVVEGHAAGGAVVVRMSGALQAESVSIDPSVIDRADPSLLEDAVLAALRDALAQVIALTTPQGTESASGAVGGIDLAALAGGFDLGDILGGVDIQALMGSLGLAQGVFGSEGDSDQQSDADEAGQDPEA